jgi:hypothetical protein
MAAITQPKLSLALPVSVRSTAPVVPENMRMRPEPETPPMLAKGSPTATSGIESPLVSGTDATVWPSQPADVEPL